MDPYLCPEVFSQFVNTVPCFTMSKLNQLYFRVLERFLMEDAEVFLIILQYLCYLSTKWTWLCFPHFFLILMTKIKRVTILIFLIKYLAWIFIKIWAIFIESFLSCLTDLSCQTYSHRKIHVYLNLWACFSTTIQESLLTY